MSLRVKLMSLVIAGLPLAASNAQTCTFDWKPGDGYPGIIGDVYDVINWDPDGAGPQPEWLVAGGLFSIAGDAKANSVAIWDGSIWHALGDGVLGIVYALGVYENDLIVGGDIYMAGGQYINNIARWDGTAWHAMDLGLGRGLSIQPVRALKSFNGELYAGGQFEPFKQQPLKYIARWNGRNWNSVGAGVDGVVISFAINQGKLIVGGEFLAAGGTPANSLAAWDGSNWSNFEQGLAPNSPGIDFTSVYKLVEFRNELYASGRLLIEGSPAQLVARWNGTSWTGTGLPGGIHDLANELIVFQDRLIAGGDIRLQSSFTTPHLLAYDGLNWQSVVPTVTEALNDRATALGVYNGKLIVGGENDFVEQLGVNGVLSWDGTSWGRIGKGMNDGVLDLTVWRNQLIAGGNFTSAGQHIAKHIARFDGRNWQPIGGGVDRIGHSYTGVVALASFANDLIVGGWFTLAGDLPVSGVARWDGGSWNHMGGDLGDKFEALVNYKGRLIATGMINHLSPLGYIGLASWEGRNWVEFGGNLNGSGRVLIGYGDDLFVGGTFNRAGLVPANNIARWNGFQWDNMDGGCNGLVSAIIPFGGQLIAGGSFTTCGATSARYIAAWDGAQWTPLGAGMEYPTSSLVNYNGLLVAPGPQNIPGQSPPKPLVGWDGHTWQPLSSAVNGNVMSMAVHDRDVLIGGFFLEVGELVSPYLARWGPSVELGDYNANQRVELSDFQQFPNCLSGPAGHDASAIAAMDCLCVYNSDADADIDLVDFAAFQLEYGPQRAIPEPAE